MQIIEKLKTPEVLSQILDLYKIPKETEGIDFCIYAGLENGIIKGEATTEKWGDEDSDVIYLKKPITDSKLFNETIEKLKEVLAKTEYTGVVEIKGQANKETISVCGIDFKEFENRERNIRTSLIDWGYLDENYDEYKTELEKRSENKLKEELAKKETEYKQELEKIKEAIKTTIYG